MTKRIAGFFAAAFLGLASTTVVAAGTVISVEAVNGTFGEIVAVPVKITGNPGISAMVLRIEFDNAYVEPVSVSKSALLEDGLFVKNLSAVKDSVHSVNVTWANSGNMSDDGVLYTVKFLVKREGNSVLRLTAGRNDISNEAIQTVPCIMQSGSVASPAIAVTDPTLPAVEAKLTEKPVVHAGNITGSAKVTVTNYAQEGVKNAAVLIAVYEKNGKLLTCAAAEDVDIAPNENLFEHVFYIENVTADACTVKVFVWRSLASMQPLTEAVTESF